MEGTGVRGGHKIRNVDNRAGSRNRVGSWNMRSNDRIRVKNVQKKPWRILRIAKHGVEADGPPQPHLGQSNPNRPTGSSDEDLLQ